MCAPVKYRALRHSRMCILQKITPHLRRRRTFLIGAAFVFYFFTFGSNKVSEQIVIPYVVVHLDLKGAPPTLKFLGSILGSLKEYGVKALLIEYEDMFPFEKSLSILRAQNAYKRPELQQFLTKAVKLGFDIIPLVQTFGHMEYVLKHDEFKSLREHPNHAEAICPSQSNSKLLIMNMLEQIIHFHEKITKLKYIHVGFDEVYELNSCKYCIERQMEDMPLFQNHIQFVYDTVQNFTPNTKVLLWDDMLRGKDELVNMRVPIELVCWYYHDLLTNEIDVTLRKYYEKNFLKFWAASAFKGADDPLSILPNVYSRALNNYRWIHYLTTYNQVPPNSMPEFQGIILTGWSRYTHFSPACDVLSASMHSLYLNLWLIRKFKTHSFPDADWEPESLSGNFRLSNDKNDIQKEPNCHDAVPQKLADVDGRSCVFPGYRLNAALKTFQNFSASMTSFETSIFVEMTVYLNGTVEEFEANKLRLIRTIHEKLAELSKIRNTVSKVMEDYHDIYTVSDFVNEQFHPIEGRMNWLSKYVESNGNEPEAYKNEYDDNKGESKILSNVELRQKSIIMHERAQDALNRIEESNRAIINRMY